MKREGNQAFTGRWCFSIWAIFVIFIEIAITRQDSDADIGFCFFKEINLKGGWNENEYKFVQTNGFFVSDTVFITTLSSLVSA